MSSVLINIFVINSCLLKILNGISTPIEITNRELLIKCASTSLNSKVVSQQSSLLGPLAVDAVLKIVEPGIYVFLKNIYYIILKNEFPFKKISFYLYINVILVHSDL